MRFLDLDLRSKAIRPAGIGGNSANQVGKTCALSALSRCIWLSPGQSGDRRDDVFVYALRIGERPVCHPSPLSGLGPMTGGAVFPRLSRLLNQENALSVPCYAVIPAPRRPRRRF
jgi:hypothetical protein